MHNQINSDLSDPNKSLTESFTDNVTFSEESWKEFVNLYSAEDRPLLPGSEDNPFEISDELPAQDKIEVRDASKQPQEKKRSLTTASKNSKAFKRKCAEANVTILNVHNTTSTQAAETAAFVRPRNDASLLTINPAPVIVLDDKDDHDDKKIIASLNLQLIEQTKELTQERAKNYFLQQSNKDLFQRVTTLSKENYDLQVQLNNLQQMLASITQQSLNSVEEPFHIPLPSTTHTQPQTNVETIVSEQQKNPFLMTQTSSNIFTLQQQPTQQPHHSTDDLLFWNPNPNQF